MTEGSSIHRETERDAELQQWHVGDDLAGDLEVADEPLEVPLLEDLDDDAERGRQAQHVEGHRLERDHQAAGHQREQDDRRQRHHQQRPGQAGRLSGERVVELCPLTGDLDIEGRGQVADGRDQVPALARQRVIVGLDADIRAGALAGREGLVQWAGVDDLCAAGEAPRRASRPG